MLKGKNALLPCKQAMLASCPGIARKNMQQADKPVAKRRCLAAGRVYKALVFFYA